MIIAKYFGELLFDYPVPKPTDGGNASLQTALTIVFGLLGSISLIVIIYSGLRLLASRGNPDAIGKLRGTLIYAAIGLIVALTAGGIIRFVIDRLN